MRLIVLALVLAGCGGQASYTCGPTAFEFEPDCAEAQNRITTAFAMLELFETDPKFTPPPPALVEDRPCAADSCLGSEMGELLHRLLHDVDERHDRLDTYAHVDWGAKGYTEAVLHYAHWVSDEESSHPLRKAP